MTTMVVVVVTNFYTTHSSTLQYIQRIIQTIIKNFYLLYTTFRDPTTPRYLKIWIIGTGIYTILPIDGIMDTIPLLGQIDDVILIIILIQTLQYWKKRRLRPLMHIILQIESNKTLSV